MHANQAVPAHWLALTVDGSRCGWVDPDTARCLVRPSSPFQLDGAQLALAPDPGDRPARSRAMDWAARRLREAGIVREWRSEQLDVHAEDGRIVATIERAACRALGIETRSVQLNAFRPDGSLKPEWLGRLERLLAAADKRGMIVNLMYFYQGQDELFESTEAIHRADKGISARWGFMDWWKSLPRAKAPWAIESRPGWG